LNPKGRRARCDLGRSNNRALPGPAPLHGRHRDKNGEVSKKHGKTLVGTLRNTYGAHFAPGCDDRESSADVLHKLDEPPLRQLVRDTPGAEG
jgi:hypothetical protein